MKFQPLSRSFRGFKASVRAVGFSDNGSASNRQQSDVCNETKILCRIEAVYLQALLPRLLEAGIVTLGFGSERINFLERNALVDDIKPERVHNANDVFSDLVSDLENLDV